MDFILNLLIIIFAIIGFLIFYLYSTRREDRRKNPDLPLGRGNFETGENISPDLKVVSRTNEEDLKKTSQPAFLRLLNIDPVTIFAYWNINYKEFFQNQPYLRLYDLEHGLETEIKLKHQERHRFLKTKPGHKYKAIIGYFGGKKFHTLLCSNVVVTPREKPAKSIDQKWKPIKEITEYCYRVNEGSFSIAQQGNKENMLAGSFVKQ